MGFISSLRNSDKNLLGPTDAGRRAWRELFATSKEDSRDKPRVSVGNSYGRSTVSSAAATIRLLQALRSMAPGGWSDDRWEQTKHFRGVNYVAIDRLGWQFSQAEFQIFRKVPNHPDGKMPVTENDPPQGGRLCKPWDLVKLLENPNNKDSFGIMMYRWTQQECLTGKALTWMVPNRLGTPMELYTIPTAIAIPQPAVNPDFPDGYYRIQPVYPYGPFSSYPTPTSAVGAAIPAQWIMEFQCPHPLLRYDGYSPLTGLNLEIDEFEQLGRSRWYKMLRSLSPSAVLQMDEMEGAQQIPPEERDRIIAEFENTHTGVENEGHLFVTSPGCRLEEWGRSPREMDYQNSFEQLASFILGGGFGITKPAAGMVEASSYSNLYAALQQLHLTTLKPRCDVRAQYLTKLLAPFFGDDLIVEIRCPKVNDFDILLSKVQAAANFKCVTKRDVLKLLDLPLPPDNTPWLNDIAGDPSPAEMQAQQGAAGGAPGGMPGMPPSGGEGGQPMAPPPGTDVRPEPTPGEFAPAMDPSLETLPKPDQMGLNSRGPGRGSKGPGMKRFAVNGNGRR